MVTIELELLQKHFAEIVVESQLRGKEVEQTAKETKRRVTLLKEKPSSQEVEELKVSREFSVIVPTYLSGKIIKLFKNLLIQIKEANDKLLLNKLPVITDLLGGKGRR